MKFIPHCSLYGAVIGTTQLGSNGEDKGDDRHTKRIIIQIFETVGDPIFHLMVAQSMPGSMVSPLQGCSYVFSAGHMCYSSYF